MTLHAVFVIDTGTSALTVSKAEVRDVLEELGEAQSEEALRDIRVCATEHDVDLVVVGTHGRSGLERYLSGSVAEQVIRDSPAPVLTVNSPADRDAIGSQRE